jgi:hypothetical protein
VRARARRSAAAAPRRAFAVLAWSLLALSLLAGCASRGTDPRLMDSLAEMEIRIRLLQSELTDMRQAMAERAARRERGDDGDGQQRALQTGLDELQQQVAALPEQLAAACPARPEPQVNTQCEAEVQRVVVSGDKLVVGEVERIWVDPPGAFLQAKVDAAADYSFIDAEEVVEFERDGNRWIRFGVAVGEETMNVERPLKRFARARSERRPVVDLRVQLGDVREAVEFALADLSDQDQPVVLGRNFLTDVALLDVARKHVQPASPAPSN